MAKKDVLFKAINELIKMVEESIKEREEMMRAICCAYGVSNYDDIEDHAVWNCGFQIDSQLEDLNDLLDDLKREIKYIGTFKDVI